MRLAPSGLTRRAFLRRAGFTASLAALARIPAVAAAAVPVPPGAGGLLSASEREILGRVVERVVRPGEGAPPTGDTARAVATIEALLGRLDRAVVADLPLALRLVEWGPFVFDLTFTRFTRMTGPEQDASLRCWMTSRLALRRLAFLALRNLAFIGHYAQPAAWKTIGYKGPLLPAGGAP